MNVGNVLMKLQKTTMKSASCFLNFHGRQRCVSRETKSILHERKLSAFHAVIGATFNKLYINPRLLISWHLVCCLWEWSRSAGCSVTSLLLCLNAWEIHVKLVEMFRASGLQRTAFHADGVSGLSLDDWMMKYCIKCIKNTKRHIRASVLIMWDTEKNELNKSLVLSV